MPEKPNDVNPFAAGLEEWEHPLRRRRVPDAGPVKGTVRTRSRVAATQPPAPPRPGDCFRDGLDQWEHPQKQ